MLNIVSTEVRYICECDSWFLIQIADGVPRHLTRSRG